MSKLVSGIVGAAALAVSLGVAQFAVGHDLAGTPAQVAGAAQSNHVNRSAKADRATGIAPVAGSTIVTQLSSLNDTSVAIRMPKSQTMIRDRKAGGKIARRPVACEAPASVLTDIAKQLESGRCVT